jgi:hypothetical protein
MGHVSANNVSASSHAERIAAGNAAASPCVCRHIAEERKSGHADVLKFFHMAGPRDVITLAGCGDDILVKAGQRAAKVAGEPQGAKKKDALSVIYVVPHLADCPFIRRVVIQRFLF